MKNKITEIADKVRNLGVVCCHNFLGDQDLDRSKKIVRDINCIKDDQRGIFETNIKYRLKDTFLKFKFKKIKYAHYFINLSKKLFLKEIADEIFNCEASLARVDCYMSPKSDDPVLQWHVDQAYGGTKNITRYLHPESQTIKFFFHLSDVSRNNGCFGYIPRSHNIAFALKKGIYERTLKYTPYWSLHEFRKTILIDKNYTYLKKIVNENILKEFLKNTETSIFLELKKEFDLKYNFEPIKAGGAIIFNDSGAHRGSKTLINERLILRFFFRKKSVMYI